MSRPIDRFDPAEVSENEIYRFLTTQALAQNQLLHSRINTMLMVEVAALAGAINARKEAVVLIVLVLASALIILFWLFAVRDRQGQLAHIGKLDDVHKSLGVQLIPRGRYGLRGSNGVTAIAVCLIAANAALIYAMP